MVDDSSARKLVSCGSKNELGGAVAAKSSVNRGMGVWPTRSATLAARRAAPWCEREANGPVCSLG